MASLYGNKYGYRPEQAEYDSLCAVAVLQKFDELKRVGVTQQQAYVAGAVEEIHAERDLDIIAKRAPQAMQIIDRKCESVQLNRVALVDDLKNKIEQFRDNFRPSSMRPGRM